MQDTLNTLNDEDVIAQIVAGDVNAYERILQKYQHHVFMIVKKHIPYDQVEEVAHDVFVRTYQSLPNFSNTGSFQRWLSSIAARTCYDFWRTRYRKHEVPLSALSEKQQYWLESLMSDQAAEAFGEQERCQEITDVLDWALAKLSAEDRMVIELVYLEGLSGKEAAEMLGWSVTNVKVRSFRSRQKLRKLMSKALRK